MNLPGRVSERDVEWSEIVCNSLGPCLPPLQEMSVTFATSGEEPTSFPVSSPCPHLPNPRTLPSQDLPASRFHCQRSGLVSPIFINVDFLKKYLFINGASLVAEGKESTYDAEDRGFDP